MTDEEKFRVTIRTNTIEIRGHVLGFDQVQALAKAVKPLGAMIVVSPWEDRPEDLDRRPHSRACGILRHEHGEACSSDCPTCGDQFPKTDLFGNDQGQIR